MIAVGTKAQTANKLIMPDVTVQIGQAELPIAIENTDELVAVQFDIVLPSGFEAQEEGRLSNRSDGHEVTVRYMEGQSGTFYRVLVYSPANKAFLGQSGALLYLPITIPGNVSEDEEYQPQINNVVLSKLSGENVVTETTVGKLKIAKLPDLTVKNISADKTTMTPGENVVVSWQVENVGGLATTGGWSEQVSLVSENGSMNKLIATTYFDEALESNGIVSRQVEITLPELLGIDGNASLQVKVIPTKGTGESTSSQGNNTITTEPIYIINKVLTLTLSPIKVAENSKTRITAKLNRSGRWDEAEIFTITATEDNRIIVPQTVTIPAGQSGYAFYLTVKDNQTLDDNAVITISAAGGGYESVQQQLEIEDNEYPDLTLAASNSVLTEGETFQLTVTTSRASTEPITVTLTSENAKRFSFPQTVTIPAGETSTTVDVATTDDEVPSLDLSNAFRASAPEHNKAEIIVLLKDNDLPVLELQLTPTTVQESAGVVAVAGVLRRTTNTGSKITVKLTDDANGGLYFGNRTLTLDKGVEEVHFNFGPVDNALADGDRTYTITAAVWLSSCSCGATGESAGYVTAQLQILDDDGPALGITSSLGTVKEGGKTTLTVSRNTATTEALKVVINSDYDSSLLYDHTITIPAGKQSATVEVTSEGNGVQGDSHTVIFTVQAESHATGTCYLMVTDQTLPDVRISHISADVTEAEVSTKANLTLKVVNDGAADLPAEVAVKVYRRGESNAIGTVYTTEPIAIGGSLTLTKAITLPNTVGNYSYYAVVNQENKVQELSFTNNTSQDVTISTTAPFSVTVSTDKPVYNQGEKILITGQLTGNGTANTDVDLYVINEGTRQVKKVTTDAEGTFTYEWELYALQSGHFTVGACYPNEGLKTEMAAFDVYGLRRTDYGNITCETLVGEAVNGNIRLSNPGNLDLTDVSVEVLNKPEHISTSFATISKMEGGSTHSLTFTLNSNELSPSNEWEKIKIRIVTNEGPSIDETISYHNTSPRATLSANISQINTTMTMGESCDYSFYITNTGKGETGNITLGLPSWMKSATTTTLYSLEYGQSARVILRLTADDNMQLNVPLTGHISINCDNGNGISLPYYVKPISESTGTMVIDVTDEYTFLTEEKPHVKDAHVTIKQPVSGEIVTEGDTDTDGVFTVELPAGYYTVSVSAKSHDSYANSIMVAPGIETPVDVFLSFQAITYSWDVVETEVEDVYDIVTTVEYETRVPKPVVVVNYPNDLPYQNQIVNLVVTNKGLISAYNVNFDAQIDREGATFQPLVSLPIDTLLPQMSVIIPVLMTINEESKYDSQGGVTFGGTYYGDNNDNTEESTSAMSRSPRRREEIEEISPGCWKLTFTVPHDRRECNKKTGKWETVGTEYTSHTWYYGQCGSSDGTPGSGGIWLPSWIPTWRPTYDPNPPYDPPTDITHPDEDDNNQRTQIFDGCTTDCTDRAVDAVASCAMGALGCVPGLGQGMKVFSCIGSVIAGCHGLFREISVSTGIDCVLGGLGCAKKFLIGCPAGIFGCLKSIYDAYDTCHNKESRKSTRRKVVAVSKDNYEAIKLFADIDSLSLEKNYEIFGSTNWGNVSGEEITLVQEYLWKNMSETSVKLADDRFLYKPSALTNSDFDDFLIRIDNTLKKENGLVIESDNIINIDEIERIERNILALEEEAHQIGYKDIIELSDSVGSHYDYLLRRAEEGGSNSVCASITLQFKQTMTMTRQAFRGTLKVYNGHQTDSMTDVKLNLEVKDSDGNIATAHEFQINAESLEGFSGELALDAGWTLGGDANGTATVLFIPTKYAAPTEPKEWSFGGTLTYMDPFTGLEVTRSLAPVTLTVKPSPELDLTYFMQRDVYGDDALTLDVVEPMKPAEFALLINNKGNGDATNVKMVTQQPEIIENEKGLYIDFELISSQVNGGDAALSFGQSIANDFGNIPAHSQMYAQWWLTSTLLGHFTDYKVEASHVTSYGNEDLSLLDEVTIHELIHGFDMPNGSLTGGPEIGRAFLVNDIEDAEDLPDKLYFSNGETANVAVATTATIERTSPTTCILTITPSTTGWNYGSLIDPTHGYAELKSIVRQSDGKELGNTRFWQTDRTLRDGKDWLYENRLHFVDDFAEASPVTYILTFDPVPDVVLAVKAIGELPAEGEIAEEQVNSLTVAFNKEIDASTFTGDDITFAVQGVKQDATQIGISSEDNKSFTLDLATLTDQCPNGYYTLTVQTADITDAEGFQGKTGKQVGWILFRGGLVQLLTSTYPEDAGSVTRKPVEEAGARRLAPDNEEDPNTARYGSTVILMAEPETGYEFSNWTLNGEVVSTDIEYETTALSDMNVVANFTKKKYLVEIASTDETMGSVTGTGTGIYEHGTKIELTAVPGEDYALKNWTVGGEAVENSTDKLTLTAEGPLTITAEFLQEFFRQSMTLARGWNWMSAYLSEPLAISDLSHYVNRIVSQTDELINDPEYGLIGGISELEAGKAYKIEANSRFTNTFRGHLYNVGTAPLTLHKGWNWVAYPNKEQTELATAITNAEEGDYITSLTGFAEYAEGEWEGTLNMLTPGAGYLYKSATNKTLAFDFTTSVSGSRAWKARTATVTELDIDIHRYPNTMNVTARLYRDRSELAGNDYVIYAMVDDEIRGISQCVSDKHYLTVYGDGAAEVSFVIEDVKTGDSYIAKETLMFCSDVIGSRKAPFEFNISGTTGIDQLADSSRPMTVYTVEGILVSRDATLKTLRRLPKGVYVVNGQKCYIK